MRSHPLFKLLFVVLASGVALGVISWDFFAAILLAKTKRIRENTHLVKG